MHVKQYKAHNSALAETMKILSLRILLQFHTCEDNTKPTIPRWWRQYKAQNFALPHLRKLHKAHNFTLTPYGSRYNSMLMETIQSTQFHAGGDSTKHKILCSQRLHETCDSTLADHITIPRSWRQYKAQHSMLAETT